MPINYVLKLTKQATFTCHMAEVKMQLVKPKDSRVFETWIAAAWLEINSKIRSFFYIIS